MPSLMCLWGTFILGATGPNYISRSPSQVIFLRKKCSESQFRRQFINWETRNRKKKIWQMWNSQHGQDSMGASCHLPHSSATLSIGESGWCPPRWRQLSFRPLQPVMTGLLIAPADSVQENSESLGGPRGHNGRVWGTQTQIWKRQEGKTKHRDAMDDKSSPLYWGLQTLSKYYHGVCT